MFERCVCCRITSLLSIFLLAWSTGAAESSSPLADAAQAGDTKLVVTLLQSGCDVGATQADGMTALHWSVYHEDVDTTRNLLRAGADATAVNMYNVPVLSLACQNGNAAITRLLLEQGADANASLPGGETALMTAARTGIVDVVQALIKAGAKVSAKDRQGQTAIMWAAAAGNADVVDALIEADADFKTPLDSGFTPLFFAVREGHIEVVRRLAAAGANVNELMRPKRAYPKGPRPRGSAMILAVENGHFELAAALLEAGAVTYHDSCGFAPLHAITWTRKPLRGDGDPPPIGSGNVTSLELVETLVDHGADVNVRYGKHLARSDRLNRTGATPFLLACETGDLPLMRLLLELGADPKLVNADNCTPLLAAAGVGVLGAGDETAGTEEEALEAIALLLELGADINAVDDRGNTAMHGAAYKSWTKVIDFLVEHGADINVWNTKNKRGWTPLLIAQGHRPGNFRPSPETIQAVTRAMRLAGVELPPRSANK